MMRIPPKPLPAAADLRRCPLPATARPANPGLGHRLSAVSRLRSLRLVYVGLSHVSRNRQRKRQPPRPDLSDARRDRRPADGDARGSPALGAVPRLPGVRNRLPLRRAIRPPDRAVPHRHGAIAAGGRAAGARLVPSLDSVRPVSLSRADAKIAGLGPRWRSGWGSIGRPNRSA